MERGQRERVDVENMELVRMNAERSEQYQPLPPKEEPLLKTTQKGDNCFELSDDNDVMIIDEICRFTKLSINATPSTSHGTAVADRIVQMDGISEYAEATRRTTGPIDRGAAQYITTEGKADTTTSPHLPAQKTLTRNVKSDVVSKDKVMENLTSSGGESMFTFKSSNSNVNPMLAPLHIPGKEDPIKVMVAWYRNCFREKLCQGHIPFRTLHEEIIGELYTFINSKNPQILLDVDRWNEIRMRMLAERKRIEKSVGATLNSFMLTVERFKEGYKAGMGAALLKFVTTPPLLGGATFQSVVSVVHEQYVNNCAHQMIDSQFHHIFLPLMRVQVEEECKSLLSTKHEVPQYQELMKNAISRNIGCPESLVKDLHERSLETALASGTSSRKQSVALDSHLMFLLARDIYMDKAKQAGRTEAGNLWEPLKTYYLAEMTKYCQQSNFKSSDIQNLHQHVVQLCEMAVQKHLYLVTGINVDSIKTRLQEVLQQFLEEKYRNNQNAATTVRSTTSQGEIQLKEMATGQLSGQLCGKSVNDANSVAATFERESESMHDVCTEPRNSLGAEGDGHIRHLQASLNSTSPMLRQEDLNNLEEASGCAAPILIFQFGAKDFGLAYIDNTGQLFTVKCFTGKAKVTNSICFLKSGEYIFGTTHQEKLLDVSIEDLLDFPEKKVEHPTVEINIRGELVKIALDFQYACALILSNLLKVMEEKVGLFRSILITVPLWLPSLQRQQLKDAGLIAGFEQAFLVNESSAAMLAHTINRVSTTQGACAQGSCPKETLVLTADSYEFTAAVYKQDVVGGELTMTFNTGMCHQKVNWRRKMILSAQHAPVSPYKVISNVFNYKKNISQVIVLCDDETLRAEYYELTNAISKKVGLPQFVPVVTDTLVMHGAREYAIRLLEKISKATMLINDITYYDLEINGLNECLINRQTQSDDHSSSAHVIPANGLQIFESSKGMSKVRYPLDLWTMEENRTEKKPILTCFANNEGIYELFVTQGMLRNDVQRQRLMAARRQFLQKYFPDQILETAKRELSGSVNNIFENDYRLKGSWREELSQEATEGVRLLHIQSSKKKDVIQHLRYLKKMRIHYFLA